MHIFKKLAAGAALGVLSAALCAFPAAAAIIVQPGVELSAEYSAVLYGEAADEAADTAGDALQEPESGTGQESSSGLPGASDDTPGIIVGPGVTLNIATASEYNADIDENYDMSEETGETVDPAAQSLESPGTVIATDDPSIVYINGRSIDLTRPVIALTYDDGPRTDVGNEIMDIMAAYGQKCTFFLQGIRVAGREDELLRIVAEGHEIGNHSYSHEYFNKLSAERIEYQVNTCNDIIAQTVGSAPAVMRLPGGNKNETVLSTVKMPIILWNIDTRDWETKSTQSTINAVIGKVKSGDIVLMHETYTQTAAATAYIVPELVSEGFQMLTVSELAAVRGVTLEPGKVYYSF